MKEEGPDVKIKTTVAHPVGAPAGTDTFLTLHTVLDPFVQGPKCPSLHAWEDLSSGVALHRDELSIAACKSTCCSRSTSNLSHIPHGAASALLACRQQGRILRSLASSASKLKSSLDLVPCIRGADASRQTMLRSELRLEC